MYCQWQCYCSDWPGLTVAWSLAGSRHHHVLVCLSRLLNYLGWPLAHNSIYSSSFFFSSPLHCITVTKLTYLWIQSLVSILTSNIKLSSNYNPIGSNLMLMRQLIGIETNFLSTLCEKNQLLYGRGVTDVNTTEIEHSTVDVLNLKSSENIVACFKCGVISMLWLKDLLILAIATNHQCYIVTNSETNTQVLIDHNTRLPDMPPEQPAVHAGIATSQAHPGKFFPPLPHLSQPTNLAY